MSLRSSLAEVLVPFLLGLWTGPDAGNGVVGESDDGTRADATR